MALRTLFDSVLPALELIACQASNKATETVPADDQLSVIRRPCVWIYCVLMSLANAAALLVEEAGQARRGVDGFRPYLRCCLRMRAPMYIGPGTAEKDIDGKSVAAMLEAHLLRLGEDDEEVARYMFSYLRPREQIS